VADIQNKALEKVRKEADEQARQVAAEILEQQKRDQDSLLKKLKKERKPKP
jgi:hypothetical protein